MRRRMNEEASETIGRRSRLKRAVGAAVAVAAAGVAIGGQAHGIVGGEPTTPPSYPYYVRLVSTGGACGASVIGSGTVLTAAHCVDDLNGDASKVSLYFSNYRGTRATSMAINPNWNGDTSDAHDLAVLKVPAEFTTGITPVQVGAPGDPGAFAAGNPATVVGWGQTAPGTSSTSLRYINTVLRSDQDMKDTYEYWSSVDHWNWLDHWPDNFAIGAGNDLHTICHGDSGGPLTVDRGSRKVQVGVASFAEDWPDACAEPGGFMKLNNAHLAWIASQLTSIPSTWGACTTSAGGAGIWYSYFHKWYEATGNRDGDYYWKIWCAPKPVTTTTTRPRTTSTTEAPMPPMCQSKPWLEECANY